MNKSQGLHSIAWLEEETQWTCIDAGESPAGNERLFPHEDSQLVEQAAREVVQSPSSKIFRTGLDKALRNLG